MFDIADDRRDDGTTMSHPSSRGAVPPPPPRTTAFPPPSLPTARSESGHRAEDRHSGGQLGDGYETGGYETGGYQSGGHGSSGYETGGYGSAGYDTGYGSAGYGTGSHSGGYSSGGYSSPGHDSPGYGSSGYGSAGYGSAGYDSPGYGSAGYGSSGGYDSTGYAPSNGSYLDEPARTSAMPSSPSHHVPEGVGLPTPRDASARSNDASDMVAIIRDSFEAVSSRTDELTQLFYGWLFRIAPETRELFPVTMELQRTRLLRALIHVVQMVDRPDELNVFLRQLGRDHRKFGVIGEHYDKVGEALLGALAEIAGPAWTRDVEQAWVGAYGVVSKSMRDAADAERGPAVWMARVMEHRRVAPDLAIVRVQTSQPVPYLAGQYVSVETPQRPRMWRSLTPANAPGPDCVMEFHVHTVPGGWVSRAIVSHARVGDVWRIGPPMGQMTLDPRSQADLLMVAGGTGLAPARALIEQLMVDGSDRKVALFVGGRTWSSLYDIDTLRRMAQDNPWLTVVPVVEEDGRRYGAETGTLGEVVARYGAWADRQIVVAGSPPMVRSTVSAMLDAGTPFMQIHYDPYHTD
ncbi:FAD-binding oxidoreductase [Actinomycetospora sp. Odt1-22]|uniref:nitric oxide dioxygenase n=2 Tax=Actinomycetospora termitidis TaxID=3053470 RepID=A0ABT7MDU3_9PSEU|nr:globin domain-containing protein [Actinomycetospora sp. Odt1-22]MDL5157528.1 FAD-binding oxidoreductase [Actinomycetospora sp. Odt1-22]